MYKKKGLPEKGDLVLCTVKRVLPHSAFVDLEEYDSVEGMIHDSEISRKWVRNMKTYLKIGRKLVCKVIDTRNGISLSVRRVGPGQKRSKSEEWKLENKAHNILTVLADQSKISVDEVYKKLGDEILEKYGLIYPFLLDIAKNGDTKLKELKLDKKLSDNLVKLIKNRIQIPKAEIKVDLKMQSNSPNGVEVIKDFFKKLKEIAKKNNSEVKINYLGSPRYNFKIISDDYKIGENILNTIEKIGEKLLQSNQGIFEINKK